MGTKRNKVIASLLAATLVLSPMTSYVGFAADAPAAPAVVTKSQGQLLFEQLLDRLDGPTNSERVINTAKLFSFVSWMSTDPIKNQIIDKLEAKVDGNPNLNFYGIDRATTTSLYTKLMTGRTVVQNAMASGSYAENKENLKAFGLEMYGVTPATYKAHFAAQKKDGVQIRDPFFEAAASALANENLLVGKIIDTNGVQTYSLDVSAAFEDDLKQRLQGLMKEADSDPNLRAKQVEFQKKLVDATFDMYRVIKESILEVALKPEYAPEIQKIVEVAMSAGIMQRPTVEFADKTNPVLVIPNFSVSAQVGSTFNYLAYVSATDNMDTTVNSKITWTGTVDTSRVGTYPIVYRVIDRSGNVTVSAPVVVTVYLPTGSDPTPTPTPTPTPPAPGPVNLPNEAPALGGNTGTGTGTGAGTGTGTGAAAGTGTGAGTPAVDLGDEEAAKSGNIVDQSAIALAKLKALGIIPTDAAKLAKFLTTQMSAADFATSMSKLFGFKIANAKDPVATLKSEGLLNGVTLAKTGKITRDQMSVIITNMYNKYSKSTKVNKEIKFTAKPVTQVQFKKDLHTALQKLYSKDKIQGEANVTGKDFIIIFFTFFLK